MATRRHTRAKEAQLGFEAITIEGSLLSPEWLSKVAQVAAYSQSESDYRIPKGLNLRDEIGRYWRIAQAHWKEFATGLTSSVDRAALANRFVPSLLRESFGFTSLARVEAPVLSERCYPLGYAAFGLRVPVVIAPAASGIDTLSPAFGDDGRRRSAFGLAQEYLNAAECAVWGIATDGSTLRILRDNASLTRPAWIEADLARIFTEERYADFAALWLLLHETRFGREGQPANECALEAWREAGRKEGTRAREHLRKGVEEALTALGQGFLSHPDNQALRSALQDGSLSTRDYFSQLLRLVYRLIFLLTVEERNLLHPEGTSDAAKELYAGGYGLRRLCDRSVKRSAHDRFSDLWDSAKVVLHGLAGGEPRLGLPALAGIFASNQCPALDAARLENRALLLALFKLAWLREDGALARVNWRDMGPEELGSVYESLLELVPQINTERRTFMLAAAAGSDRKTSGSFYTHHALVEALLDKALEPIIAETVARSPNSPAEALLALSILDPACGSGHFLLAAARRLAAHVARLQANGTPSGAQYRHALRQVVGKCIYGVDLNPMAVELCKVGLWMEAMEPGLPLTFLNSHIQHGNALLGTTPELMALGIPDAAWDAIEGDDGDIAIALKKRNKQGASGQRSFDTLWNSPSDGGVQAVTKAVTELEAASDADAVELARKESKWEGILCSAEYRQQKFVADAWCAAFAWPKVADPHAELAPTNELWRQLRDGRGSPPEMTKKTVEELTQQYRFFHWHLQFPLVFAKGGFDVVLGNPPWDTLSPDAKEFFSTYDPSVRQRDKDGQIAIIEQLLADPGISSLWQKTRRQIFAAIRFIKQSGRYHLFAQGNLGKGDFNVYRMFVEAALQMTRRGGCASQIVPEGLYNGANCAAIREALFSRCTLDALWGFENTKEIWFKDIDTRTKFSLYVARMCGSTERFHGRFNIRSVAALSDAVSGNGLRIPVTMVREFSPDALAIMEFGDQRDIDIAVKMYARWPKFGDEAAGLPIRNYMREFDMGTDRDFFGENPKGLPLYEGRMVDHFDHRAKGYRSGRGRSAVWEELPFGRPDKSIQPQWRVPMEDVPEKVHQRMRQYRVGFCDVASPTNERSLYAALIPPGVVCGHKVPTIVFSEGWDWNMMVWLAVANSFTMDFLARKKVSLSMSYTVLDSLPFPRLPKEHPIARRIVPIALRLTCCGDEMAGYWNSMAAEGWVEPVANSAPSPGVESEDERLRLRAELDAIVAHDVFGLTASEIEYILATFPTWRDREEKHYREFRTKRLILEIYDALAESTRTATPCQTLLNPPSADPSCCHPLRATNS